MNYSEKEFRFKKIILIENHRYYFNEYDNKKYR